MIKKLLLFILLLAVIQPGTANARLKLGRVVYMNKNAVWNTMAYIPAIVIQSPWWAWLIYVALLITAVYAFVAYRLRNLVHVKQELERLVLLRNEEVELQKKEIEAQVHKAQTEIALERLRSKTMAMQNSNDVPDTVITMFTELVRLGVEKTVRSGIGIINDSNEIELWTAISGPEEEIKLITGRLDVTTHPMLKKLHEAWQNNESRFLYELTGQDLRDYYQNINNSPYYTVKFNLETLPPTQYVNAFFFPEGAIFVFSLEELTEGSAQIIERFASVFGMTYRRFLDLQKAEGQARESNIETSLEKVRGIAMSMHSSKDMSPTINMVFVEIKKLGVESIRCGVGLIDKDLQETSIYAASAGAEGKSLELVGRAKLKGHPVLENLYESWLKHEDYFPVLEGELLKSYYEHVQLGAAVREVPAGYTLYGCFLPLAEGGLFTWAEHAFSDADIKILKRFTAVVDLIFKRYTALQQSEANTRDTIKAASLDRVRAEIASMRTTNDLEIIIPLIWTELNTMGVPFTRCGVFIMNEQEKKMYTYLSTPGGKALAAFALPYMNEGMVGDVLDNWRKKQVFTSYWTAEQFKGFTKSLVERGAMEPQQENLSDNVTTGIDLHFLPFLQGVLYVGNDGKLSTDEKGLIQSLADAFSTAYSRYEDFNKLETAKQQVDNTLAVLKAAQTQLIQSEKMASLGELTAGIAHEIQNPLNFVNNFSEINVEMIDELVEELKSGNIDEALAITTDLRANEQKITHHGKRADGIVRGMLQHSQSSSGKKEAVDINALADEYLRLSYHGLRAKDKSFNVELITQYDKKLPPVNVIPQDLSRVLLNLFNNAFYAVNQKRKAGIIGYKPVVAVNIAPRPLRAGEMAAIVITVKDNGNGMPESIKEKIMQPFFTTKPTGEGTGLGLSLSYDIVVKGHGGTIEVESREGEGSEFVITLPVG